MEIRLEFMEAFTAATLGCMRNLSAVFKGKANRMDTGQDFQIHVEGACGEMVVAKALATYNPLTLNTFKEGADIGCDYQVRTRSKPHYDLIVREDDNPDQIYILVTGSVPEYTVHGWIHGRDARRDEWVQNYGGHGSAWFVPQSALNPIESLEKRNEV